jgi:hypothetical protein
MVHNSGLQRKFINQPTYNIHKTLIIDKCTLYCILAIPICELGGYSFHDGCNEIKCKCGDKPSDCVSTKVKSTPACEAAKEKGVIAANIACCTVSGDV